MATSIASGSILIGANIAGLSSGLQMAAAKVTAFTRNLGSTLTSIPGMPGGIFSKILGSDLSGKIGDVMEKTKLMKRTAEGLGIDPSQFSGLAYAASKAGVDVAGLAHGLTHMERTLVDAQNGGKEAGGMFAELGINFRDLSRDDPHALLLQLADSFKDMSSADRASAAIGIFGRAGADLLPILGKGSAGIAEMEEKAAALGVKLTPENFSKIAGANSSLALIKDTFEGIYVQLADALAPAIQAVGEAFAGLGGMIKPVTAYVSTLVDTSKWLIVTLLEGIAKVIDWMDKWGLKIKSIKGMFEDWQDIFAVGISNVGEYFGILDKGTTDLLVSDSMQRRAKDTRLLSDDIRDFTTWLDKCGKSTKKLDDDLSGALGEGGNGSKLHKSIQAAMSLLTESPLSKFQSELAGLDSLLANGTLSWQEYAMAIDKAGDGLIKASNLSGDKFASADLAGSKEAVSAIIKNNYSTGGDVQTQIKQAIERQERLQQMQLANGEKMINELKGIRKNTDDDGEEF